MPRPNLMHALTIGAALCVAPTADLLAQCPDGTPPPCERPRRARAPVEESVPIDSSTALVAPLTVVGADTTLRQLAATFSAIVADNMTVADVSARVADDLERLLVEQRSKEAARRDAGALVDGTLIKIGTNVRATVRLVDAKTGQQLTTTTVEGTPDNLLELADQASVELLKAWWRRQPGPYIRRGLVTSSLPALRHYVTAMVRWRSGKKWRTLLDSAVNHDPDFLAPWLWLALPRERPVGMASFFLAMMPSAMNLFGVTSDSARRMLRDVRGRQPREAQQELNVLGLPLLHVFALATGQFAPPTPTQPHPSAAYLGMFESSKVEARYLQALTARYGTLAGYPDSLALHLARKAVELDSTFAPAAELLFFVLLDRGDTVGARTVLDGLGRLSLDSSDVKDLGDMIPARYADTTYAQRESDEDQLAAAAMLAPQWHRFRALPALSPIIRELMAKEMPAPMRDRMEPFFALMFDYPAYLALGRIDSAQAAARRLIPSSGPTGTPLSGTAKAFATMSLLGGFAPPDTTFFPARLDSVALDSILTAQRTKLEGIDLLFDPATAEMMERMFGLQLVRASWLSGVLANGSGDLSTARYAAGILDSLAAEDSLTVAPLALGLRAEIALSADSGEAAESLLVRAISTSVTNAPVRYRWLLARRYAETGHLELAMRMAHSITMPSQLHGSEHVAYYAPSLKFEAEMLAQLGRREAAITVYQEFVSLRAGADSALQEEVGEVHLKLAQLLFENEDYDAARQYVREAEKRGVSPPGELLDALRQRR